MLSAVRRAALALLLSIGCEERVTLDLELQGDDCTPEALSQIAYLSVDVYGNDAQGNPCLLNQRCVSDVDVPRPAQSVEDLGRALREVEPPLIDAPYEGTRSVGVLGRREEDGFCLFTRDEGQLPACGFADLADARDGILTIRMSCGSCPDREIPFCE